MDLKLSAPTTTPDEIDAIDALLGATGEYDHRLARAGNDLRDQRHRLLPVLHAVNDRVGWISRGAINHIAARMDVDNFLRYQFVEIWCGNADWPHNNTRAWRRRLAAPLADPESAPPGHDGRWRWMLFDLDLAVAHPWAGGTGENTLSYALSPTGRPPTNAPWGTALLRALMRNPEVKRRFASLAADLMNSHFKDTRATATVD